MIIWGPNKSSRGSALSPHALGGEETAMGWWVSVVRELGNSPTAPYPSPTSWDRWYNKHISQYTFLHNES